jgi:hypothetical protein
VMATRYSLFLISLGMPTFTFASQVWIAPAGTRVLPA